MPGVTTTFRTMHTDTTVETMLRGAPGRECTASRYAREGGGSGGRWWQRRPAVAAAVPVVVVAIVVVDLHDPRSPPTRQMTPVILLNVCVIGSRSLPLLVTSTRVPSREDLRMAEASRGRVPAPASAQLGIQYIRTV
eukprot:COSAG02_NODE_493_length_21166_cov_13.181318_3_plen_137_part_00